jgi:hypothetical protein
MSPAPLRRSRSIVLEPSRQRARFGTRSRRRRLSGAATPCDHQRRAAQLIAEPSSRGARNWAYTIGASLATAKPHRLTLDSDESNARGRCSVGTRRLLRRPR